MKRLFLILFITTAMTVVSVAQPRAIGVRIGGNQELSFQQGIHYGKRFVQFDVGSFYAKGLQITWTYNWLSQAVGNSAFSVYGGLGLGAGFIWGENDNAWYPRFLDTKAPDYMERKLNHRALRRYGFGGLAAQLGLEYRFDNIPLAISLDYRPLIGIEIGKLYYPNGNNPNIGKSGETLYYSQKLGIGYHTPGLWAFGLSARYCF